MKFGHSDDKHLVYPVKYCGNAQVVDQVTSRAKENSQVAG